MIKFYNWKNDSFDEISLASDTSIEKFKNHEDIAASKIKNYKRSAHYTGKSLKPRLFYTQISEVSSCKAEIKR